MRHITLGDGSFITPVNNVGPAAPGVSGINDGQYPNIDRLSTACKKSSEH